MKALTYKNLPMFVFFFVISNNVFAESICQALERACTTNDKHVVLAEPAVAKQILQIVNDSAARYETYFSHMAGRVAVVSGGDVDAELNKQLNAAGYTVVLPWFSDTDREKLETETVRRAVEEQTKGLPSAIQEEVMQKALAQLKAQSAPRSDKINETEAGVLSHELGHLWFMQQYAKSKSTSEAEQGYASWAPDWLDESVAVLLENDKLTRDRREDFKNTSDVEFLPLVEFLSMQHPVFEAAKSLAKESNPKSDHQSIVLTGDEAAEFFNTVGGDPAGFYLQVRLFLDFITEKSGDPNIIAKIATKLAEGMSFDDWVRANVYPEFPNDMEQLNKHWQQWLAAQRSTAVKVSLAASVS